MILFDFTEIKKHRLPICRNLLHVRRFCSVPHPRHSIESSGWLKINDLFVTFCLRHLPRQLQTQILSRHPPFLITLHTMCIFPCHQQLFERHASIHLSSGWPPTFLVSETRTKVDRCQTDIFSYNITRFGNAINFMPAVSNSASDFQHADSSILKDVF